MSLVKNWADAFLRPVRASPVPAEAKAKFLPDTDDARVTAVDFAAMAAAQKGFSDRYLAEVI